MPPVSKSVRARLVCQGLCHCVQDPGWRGWVWWVHKVHQQSCGEQSMSWFASTASFSVRWGHTVTLHMLSVSVCVCGGCFSNLAFRENELFQHQNQESVGLSDNDITLNSLFFICMCNKCESLKWKFDIWNSTYNKWGDAPLDFA